MAAGTRGARLSLSNLRASPRLTQSPGFWGPKLPSSVKMMTLGCRNNDACQAIDMRLRRSLATTHQPPRALTMALRYTGAVLYLFDINGTLIHCHGAGRRALDRALMELLGEAALEGIRLDGKTDPAIVDEAFQERRGRTPTGEEAAQIAARYAANLEHESAERVVKLPGVDQALAVCGGRGVLGLATGNWRAGARIKLGRVSLWSQFVLGGFGCDAPDRGDLVRIARQCGEAHRNRRLHHHEVVVIGDTPRDIAAARAADATAIAVATGAYDLESLRTAGADAVYPDLVQCAASFS